MSNSMDNFMNYFTIITTLLNLLLCVYTGFKKEEPTYSQRNALLIDPTINISMTPPSSVSILDDVHNDNYKFKTSILYFFILGLIAIIFASWFVYGWTTLDIPKESIPLLTYLQKANHALFFSLTNTGKSTILSVGILSCGLVFKNIKNAHSHYRPFHIIFYSLLTISTIINFIALLDANYTDFLPNTDISAPVANLGKSFLISIAPAISMLQIGLILICIYKLSHACIYGEYKSPRLRINFQHILERMLAPIIFFLFAMCIYVINR